MNKHIDIAAMEDLMRVRCVDVEGQRVLLSRLAGTKQERDLTIPTNCGGFGRVRHFKLATAPGWPTNPLPSLPFSTALRRGLEEVTRAQLFQISGCAMRCWYCFVPYTMLSGDDKYGAWHSAEEILEAYVSIEGRPDLIVLSGGSPDIAPEWSAWMMDGLEARGLASSTYLWSDDNLSSRRLFTPENRSLLRRIERYRNYGRVCCLKGYDERSFAFTTQAEPEAFEEHLSILQGYLETELDLYGYITFAAPDPNPRPAIARLLDRLCELRADFVSRIVPLRIEQFGPTSERIDARRKQALGDQDAIVEVWLDELSQRDIVPIWSAVT